MRIPEADVKSVRLFFLHIFHRTAMFIDGAAAAYKSKNGMVRFTRAISFMTIECSQNVRGACILLYMTIECSQNVRGACILLYGKEIEEKLA